MRQLKFWFSLPSHILICSIYLADITWLKMKCVLSLHKTVYDSVYFYSDVPSDMPKYWSHFIAGKLAVLSRTASGGRFKHCWEGEVWGQVERWAEYPRLGILFFHQYWAICFSSAWGKSSPHKLSEEGNLSWPGKKSSDILVDCRQNQRIELSSKNCRLSPED